MLRVKVMTINKSRPVFVSTHFPKRCFFIHSPTMDITTEVSSSYKSTIHGLRIKAISIQLLGWGELHVE